MIDVPLTFVFFGTITVLAGHPLTHLFVKFLREQIRVPPISDDPLTQTRWEKLTEKSDKSGMWVGYLERIIFFSALLLGATQAREAVAGIGVWLAFKVAAKWESWNHMAHVPETINGVDDLHLAYARRIWAAHGYATFVMGTGANFVIAAVGAAGALYARSWLGCLLS